MIQKAQNYSAYSELLSVFRITQRIQNYSAYSELLSVFRITQRIQNYSAYSELLSVFRITPHIQNYSAYSLFTRASRKASPERLTFRPPVGVLSAYHALILVRYYVATWIVLSLLLIAVLLIIGGLVKFCRG